MSVLSVFSTTGGGSFLLLWSASSSGSGSSNARLGKGEDGTLYIYNNFKSLLESSNGGSIFTEVYPTTATSNITGVEKVSAVTGSGSWSVGGDVSGVYYQAPTETPGGWITTTVLPAKYSISDMLYGKTTTQGLLVGNRNGADDIKIMRFDPANPPFTTVARSDSGLPSGSGSAITDLDVAG